MEQLHFSYQGQGTIEQAVRTGNVGSGDLEILLEPNKEKTVSINLTTSVDNRRPIWEAIFQRYFNSTKAMQVTVNDFGATPGVIGLRLAQALEQLSPTESLLKIKQNSFIEMSARARAKYLLDPGSFREILGCTDHLSSPWLLPQGVVPQTDDGCIVAKGCITGKAAVVLAIDGVFQGGAIGEISGAKIAAALELALQDAKKGKPLQVILLMETGGVRLQEANLGLAAIADIHAGIIALREYTEVTGIIAGTVGCFGGMSIAAGLCSRLIITQEARLGLNGPQVIEQEAGIVEYDSSDRPFIWSLSGGEQRFETGFADIYVEDNAEQILTIVQQLSQEEINQENKPPRCEQIEHYLTIINNLDTQKQASSKLAQLYFAPEGEEQ